ncbi:MAG: hypothetical protein GY874_00970 [Desulfobacteraceae bacterium]|nr:hypothetical protein [Desulfobacteraceae bacterium]
MANWIDLLGASFLGALLIKVIDYIYQTILSRSKAKKTAKDIIDKHLDPILKSADELVGKIRSLAQTDFKEIKKFEENEKGFKKIVDHLNIAYLFAQFWARIQILRKEGNFVNLGSDKRGKKLLDFINTLEGKRTRIVTRAWQRGIGEVLLSQSANNNQGIITFPQFVNDYLNDETFRRWLNEIVILLSKINHTSIRQKFLLYGVIIHSLIDTLDPNHLVTKKRPGLANKLSQKSKRNLRYRIFKLYLPFVSGFERYIETN